MGLAKTAASQLDEFVRAPSLFGQSRDEMIQEYLEGLSRLEVPEFLVKRLAERFARRKTITHVSLGSRAKFSRDLTTIW